MQPETTQSVGADRCAWYCLSSRVAYVERRLARWPHCPERQGAGRLKRFSGQALATALSAACLALGLGLPSTGHAQRRGTLRADAKASETEMATARTLFESGLDAAKKKEWAQARDLFARSYAIAEVPATLLNLASAQVHTGQLVAGAENYQRFLSRAHTGPAARYRAEAESARAKVLARIPHVRIELQGGGPDDRVEIDDRAVARAVVGTRIPLDPGPHTVRVMRGANEVDRASFALEERDEHSVRLVAPPPSIRQPVDSPHSASESPARDASSARASRRRWIGISIGVAVVIGGVLAAVLLTRDRDDGHTGNLGPGRVSYGFDPGLSW